MPEGSPGSVEEVFKAEWGGLVATLIRHLGDFDLAEDSAAGGVRDSGGPLAA